MSEMQAWTLIGGFFALMVAQMALAVRVIHIRTGRVHDALDQLDRDVQRLASKD